MDCKELTSPPLLIERFREKADKELNRIFSCFYEKYFRLFISIASEMSLKHPTLKNDTMFYASQAFNEALLVFHRKLCVTGFSDGRGSVKTLFMAYCKWQLRGIATKELRESKKRQQFTKENGAKEEVTLTGEELYSEQELLLQKALEQLDEKQRKYIVLRKMYNLSNEQIAAETGVSPATVTNEVYRAFVQLKKIIDSLKGKSK